MPIVRGFFTIPEKLLKYVEKMRMLLSIRE